jgi:hypothetical protein
MMRPGRRGTTAAIVAGAGLMLLMVLAAARILGDLAGDDRAFDPVPRLRVSDLSLPEEASDEAVLGRPIAMAFSGERLYVADALDCSVKFFSAEGRFRGAFGGKGQGPGQLSFPSGVCLAGDLVAVADKLNFRLQFFDGGGAVRGGFKLPFAPDRLAALGGSRLLVTSNPTGKRAGERLLHVRRSRDRRLP